jgi:hypothetical protein
MSKVMTAAQYRAQFKKWGVRYVEMDGWENRGRPASTGAFGDMHGIVNHHTATSKSADAGAVGRMLRDGRPDLPGPLCHVSTRRDGVVVLVARLRANHAGGVRPEVLNDFLNDRHVTRPSTTSGETVDANAFTYGNEVQNNGTGEKYPDEQLRAAACRQADEW